MITIRELQRLSVERDKTWTDNKWSTMEWACAMAGEAGEACNVAKKINRIDNKFNRKEYDRPTLVAHLGEECADTLCYLVLLCAHAGIDLEAAVAKKFNAVSALYGFPQRLPDEHNL